MYTSKKIFLFALLILSLSLISGCSAINELKDTIDSRGISISDDSPDPTFWFPKDSNAIL